METAYEPTSARTDMGPWIRRAGGMALDLLYPPLCLICRAKVADPSSLCADCWTKLTFFDGAMCSHCGLPFEIDPGGESLCGSCSVSPPTFDVARAAVAYDDLSKRAVLGFKRGDRLEFARLFARWTKRAGKPLLDSADIIVPVPLHRLRLWTRRYNQAAVLAQQLALLGNKPFNPFLLVRTKITPSQGSMPSAKARARNVRGAFKVPIAGCRLVAQRNVLLVDDVLTTGSTVDACARALKRAGAEKVFVLTIARVARPLPRAI